LDDGRLVGFLVGDIGFFVGFLLGTFVPLTVGTELFLIVGRLEGFLVGFRVGLELFLIVGLLEGFLLGFRVGRFDGARVGRIVGNVSVPPPLSSVMVTATTSVITNAITDRIPVMNDGMCMVIQE
jgi:hypothetical protein